MNEWWDYPENDAIVYDPSPAPVETYYPDFAFVKYWEPGRRFKIVKCWGLSDKDMLGEVVSCEFAVARYATTQEAIIYYKDSTGQRRLCNWSDVEPLDGIVDMEHPIKLVDGVPEWAHASFWKAGMPLRIVSKRVLESLPDSQFGKIFRLCGNPVENFHGYAYLTVIIADEVTHLSWDLVEPA